MESALYIGTIRHRRFRPARHEFTYPVFLAMLEIDRIEELMQVSRLSSYQRWNWASYCERDHFGDPQRPLRERLREDAARNGLTLPAGRIFLLTHLRYLGYNFNPVCFYFCLDEAGALQTVLAEVRNTWGETHNYWMSAHNQVAATEHAQSFAFDKAFHVSPFLTQDCRYRWTFTVPGESLVIQSNLEEHGEATLDTTLKMQRHPWTAANLRRTLFRYPLVTARTVAAIHWQALLLYFKQVPFVPHPGPGHFAAANTRPLGANWSIR